MAQVKPFIKCIDYWPGEIPENKLAAYKQMIDEGQISVKHAVINQTTGCAVIEYYAAAPHDWIREELKKRARRAET